MKNEKDFELVNPLLGWTIFPIFEWKKWLEKWGREDLSLQEREGLLHCGFDIPVANLLQKVERIILYLSVADGWSEFYLRPPHEEHGRQCYYKGGYVDLSLFRRVLATKAFNMLCAHFFKLELENEDRNIRWEWKMILFQDIFPVLKSFFRVEPPFYLVRNLPRPTIMSHNDKIAANFLLNLAKFFWKWEPISISSFEEIRIKEEKEKENKIIQDRINLSKPWMIEVMDYLRKLDILKEWMLEFDEECLNKLKEIALRAQVQTSNGFYPVKTVEQAILADSPAALFLIERNLKKREFSRFRRTQKRMEKEK